jgi:YidC/Oxa1 family membrane protein insertase
MNIKDFLLPLGIALISFWFIQYFFLGKQQLSPDGLVKSGQHFVAPQAAQAAKPLNTEIDFIDMKRPAQAAQTEVETDGARYIFSTVGASLERLEFKRQVGKEWLTIDTIFPPNEYEKEQRCFLVALDEKTPYYYHLVDRKEDENDVTLMYRTDFGDCTIEKKFIIFKHSYQLDLEVHCIPKKGITRAFELRLFYISPRMPELKDVVSALVQTERGSLEKKLLTSLDPRSGWFNPPLFGSDSKYFIHAMINDATNFAQRAYYSIIEQTKLISILEGSKISQESSWKFSFYFGPKELGALNAVLPILEQTLDYAGWLAPIAKFTLAFLIFLFGYLGNYGIAIIVLTILIRLLLVPFTIKGEQDMKKRADYQKKLSYLQERYKHDRQRLAQEQAELIRKHGMPGMASCLPLFLQLPIFFVLSRVLSSSIELYKAPFMLWITDLSASDPYFILPLLITVTMLLQPQPPSTDIKTRLPVMGLSLLFGAISATFSAGLSLYIFCSSLLQVVQTMIQRRIKF